jgi:hypothetical protein
MVLITRNEKGNYTNIMAYRLPIGEILMGKALFILIVFHVVLTTLSLMGIINIPWYIVAAPLMIPFAMIMAFLLLILFVYLIQLL